VKKWNFVNIND